MSIRETLADQMRRALKAGQSDRLRALRMLKAELEVAAASGRDFKELDVVRSHAKKLRRTLEEYEGLGLKDRVEALRTELAVVEEFLPRQMDRAELERLIEALVQQHGWGPGDIGRLMKAVMSEHGDVVDGRLAREIAQQKLQQGT